MKPFFRRLAACLALFALAVAAAQAAPPTLTPDAARQLCAGSPANETKTFDTIGKARATRRSRDLFLPA